MQAEKSTIISKLQQDILLLQGFKPSTGCALNLGLGPLTNAFPNCTFPLAAMHEFIMESETETAATLGFVTSLLGKLMGSKGISLWISSSRTLFPPALIRFGIQPDKFIFIDLKIEKHVLWAMEEALKCNAVTAVVGELKEISFMASRRFQLAVEDSRVTGFILRHNPKILNTTACVSRWKITSLPSLPVDDLPGIGFSQWKVELMRIRNGRPGVYEVKSENGNISVSEDLTFRRSEQSALVYPTALGSIG